MKIKQIMTKNFATVNEICIDITDDVTYLVGENGSGKTTIGLNAIWFILEGIAKTGKKVLHADRFRFIGKYGKSAIGQITLYDEKEDVEIYIQRRMTKDATKLQIACSDESKVIDADFVDKIFNIFSINPEGFSQLTPKEQATALGIDTSKIDAEKKDIYEKRREAGYSVKQTKGELEEYASTAEVEHIDLAPLLKEKERREKKNGKAKADARTKAIKKQSTALDHNEKQNKIQKNREKFDERISFLVSRTMDIEEEVAKLKAERAQISKALAKMPQPEPLLDTHLVIPPADIVGTEDLEKEIADAESQNKQADRWEEYEKRYEKYQSAANTHETLDVEYRRLEQKRIEYLKGYDLPFSNTTISDSGELLVDGRPFCTPYFSKGEILRAGVKMAVATNPELKYVFIPNAQDLDDKNREELFAELIKNGYQIVAEMVGTEKRKDHSTILLRESRVVDNYDNKKNTL